ncbi:hypothetical protein EDC45_1788 [Mesocricetibacter intestinalis]|uniref:Cyclophilin-like domain-containing protein n=1 Tax=Mesocricetibacter intestinalis TaxID=1521930 RepID=A0A4R6VGE8_9PAST|nr:cyclophilin-like fold protein [Mesocricetibacter intestinalis]TDQ56829.1 hypothetical protein EDC45_1788 [Mesocricetibacter intestinalis]
MISRSATAEPLRIEIQIENQPQKVLAVLAPNPTAQDFYRHLPLNLTLDDYVGAEKIASLPRRLSTQGSPSAYAGKKGDLTYYAPWGNLAIFYRDSNVGNARGLIYLGKIQQGLELLNKLEGANISIRPAE